ncbi:MAG: heme-binding protein [Planctomycetota bacterium]
MRLRHPNVFFLTACLSLGCAATTKAEPDDVSLDGSDPPPVLVEAELPAGYPAPGPAGEVRLKEYPVYRAARAEGRNAFGRLFQHISRHDIPMTAPVEMTLGVDASDSAGDAVARLDMFFMYETPDQSPAPQEVEGEPVEVLDLPAVTVLSLGFFGDADDARVAEVLARLDAELADRPDLEAAGPPRLLGYNSPFVPRDRRFYEVQQPVRPAEAPPEASPQVTPQPPADAEASER